MKKDADSRSLLMLPHEKKVAQELIFHYVLLAGGRPYLNDFELECLSSKIIFQSEIEFSTFFAWFALFQVHVHQ